MTASAPPSSLKPFSLKLLMFQTFACTMAMMAFTTLAGPMGSALQLAPWQMGLAVAAGGVAWMVAAHPWGRASDRRGRRPILLLGLGGFALCYAGLCLSASLALRGLLSPLAALAAFIVWRGLAGTCYAAVPVVGNALIADHTPHEQRAGALAALGVASGASMAIGPALAALLAGRNLEAPLYVMAFLPAIAFIALWFFLPKDGARQPAPGGPSSQSNAPLPNAPLSDRRLRRPAVAAFLCMACVAAAQIIVGFYAIDRLGVTPQESARIAGLALASVGVALIAAQGAVRRYNWPPERLAAIGPAVAAVGFVLGGFADATALLYAGYFVAATGMGLAWPAISALAANAVDRHEQGAAAGAVSAAQGLGAIVGPTAGVAIYGLAPSAPYVLAAALLAGLALSSARLKK